MLYDVHVYDFVDDLTVERLIQGSHNGLAIYYQTFMCVQSVRYIVNINLVAVPFIITIVVLALVDLLIKL